MRQLAVVQLGHFAARQQFGAIAFLAQAGLGEFVQHLGLVGIARQHQRAVGANMELRLVGQFQPQLARLLGVRQHHARRLAGHDDLAEVADGGAMRLAAALDHGHDRPRCGAQACAMPSMPAPTTIRRIFSSE